MRSFLSSVQFAKPMFLWLVVALPLLWFRIRDRSWAVILWRTIVVVLLILALADPQSVSETATRQENIFAFDLSKSIPESMRVWMKRLSEDGFKPRDGDKILAFAGEPKEASNWREWFVSNVPQADALRPQRTNLEKLFQALLAGPPAPRNVFLFTDGWETEGNVERLLPAIAGSGLKVFPVLPAEQPKITNVAVTKLVAPNHGESGESVNLKVALENQSSQDIDGTLTLTRDGQPFRTEALKLKPGSHLFTYATVLPETQLAAYRAAFTAKQAGLDVQPADNQAFAWVSVRKKAKVLLLNGRSGVGRYLEEILKREGLEVTSRLADSPPPPSGFGIVIFNNVEREKFSSAYLASIEKHVADGNGFLMLGAEVSFGPGFRRTPIETILPVEFKEPKREERNRAVVLVLDKSGSMREDNRILYAQEAAKAVARQLKDNDLLGVVAFDISPFIIVPVEPVGRLRGTYDTQIDRLRPGGQTFFYPALLEAKRQLEKQNAGHKHIILLSDGETRGSQGELIDLVNVMKTEMKITVSAVAVGSDADIRVMKRISHYGGGLFHHTIDPRTVPQIVLQQLQDKPVDEPPAERDFSPVQEKGSEILASLYGRTYPTVRGFMETELKRGAQLDLAVSKDNRKAPLLASWRYGKGKSAAITTDLEGRWTRNWIQWNGLQSFWDKIIDWLGPAREPIPAYELRVAVLSNQPVFDLYVYDETSADSQFRFTVTGGDAKRDGAFKKLARGHFQTSLTPSRPGDYRLEIVEERNGRRISFPPAGYTLPQEPTLEAPQPRFNLRLLEQLASISGGEINPSSAHSLEKQTVLKKYERLRDYLIGLAAILFLLEVAVRRLVLAETE